MLRSAREARIAVSLSVLKRFQIVEIIETEITKIQDDVRDQVC